MARKASLSCLPSDDRLCSLSLVEITTVRIDHAHHSFRARYETSTGDYARGAVLTTMCGETETWTFEVVPLEKTKFALVGRRGARTVVEVYEPPPPL